MTKFKLLDGTKAINTAIDSIKTRGKSLDKDIHQAAVSCLDHAEQHGDITLAEKLVKALPNSSRRNALRDWFMAYGKFNYDMKSKGFTYDKEAVTNLEQAIVTPFWEFKPEIEYVPFNLKEQITRILVKAEKAIEKGEEVATEDLATLRQLAA